MFRTKFKIRQKSKKYLENRCFGDPRWVTTVCWWNDKTQVPYIGQEVHYWVSNGQIRLTECSIDHTAYCRPQCGLWLSQIFGCDWFVDHDLRSVGWATVRGLRLLISAAQDLVSSFIQHIQIKNESIWIIEVHFNILWCSVSFLGFKEYK